MFQISKTQLEVVELIAQAAGLAPVDGISPPWYGGAAMSNEVSEELVELGVVGIALLPPVNPRRRYEKSRWVLVRDPEDREKYRFVLELHLRAAAKFGDTLEIFHTVAQLADGSIELFTKVGMSGGQAANAFGIPSGTAEYGKRWREANKEKVAKNNRKANERRKAALKFLREKEELQASGKQQELDEMAKRMGVDPSSVKA